jgi:hypothetical protein
MLSNIKSLTDNRRKLIYNALLLFKGRLLSPILASLKISRLLKISKSFYMLLIVFKSLIVNTTNQGTECSGPSV